jgi:ATP-dependent RNA helicase DDX35
MADFDLPANFIPSLHKPASLLPIARHRQNLLYLIETYPVTIVVGQTGSGKTTQIPQYLEQAGWCFGGKVIAVTQVISLLGDAGIMLTYLSLVEWQQQR